MDCIADPANFRIKIDVAEQFQSARGQIAAGRIENGVVIRERHVLEPRRRDVLIECGPTAGKPDSASEIKVIAVSQIGERQGWIRKSSASSTNRPAKSFAAFL